ncbi:MAG: acyltransferase [Pseudomonadota bacterium]
MTQGFSAYLNALRFGAALVVLIGHWSYFTQDAAISGWILDRDIARDAVVIFFVMSGLVIAYSSERKRELGLSGYTADRLGRLWSVAIPVVVISFVIVKLFNAADIRFMPNYPDNPVEWVQMSAMALSFSNQVWGFNTDVVANAPWWSLSYEAWYYAIFGVVFFLSGYRQVFWATLLFFCAGPKIWLLGPAWVAGVVLWRMIAAGHHQKLSSQTAWLGAGLTLGLYLAAQGFDIPNWIKHHTEAVLGSDVYDAMGMSAPFVWLNILGVLTAINIVCCARLYARDNAPDGPVRRSIHWFSDATYSLYLLHMPVIFTVYSLLPETTPWLTRAVLYLAAPMAVSLLFAQVFERRDWGLRARLRAWAARFRDNGGHSTARLQEPASA